MSVPSEQAVLKSKDEQESSEQSILLGFYDECGNHMRFYGESRFKIMTLAITLVSVLVTVQGLLPGTREGVCLVLGFIGLVSTIVLFTLEVRYSQAWLKLSVWAQCNVEEKLVGEKGGPLFSYRNIEPPWYWRLKASRAPTLLYYSLLAVWIGNIGYYTYCLIAS